MPVHSATEVVASEESFVKASFSRQIKQRASAEGFEKVGIVSAAPLDGEARHFTEWLARDYHADMRWMAREPEKRTNPQAIFPAARSIVVVALNYYTPDEHQDNPTTGKVSRYAWGDEYHDVVIFGLLREQWVADVAFDVRGELPPGFAAYAEGA